MRGSSASTISLETLPDCPRLQDCHGLNPYALYDRAHLGGCLLDEVRIPPVSSTRVPKSGYLPCGYYEEPFRFCDFPGVSLIDAELCEEYYLSKTLRGAA